MHNLVITKLTDSDFFTLDIFCAGVWTSGLSEYDTSSFSDKASKIYQAFCTFAKQWWMSK